MMSPSPLFLIYIILQCGIVWCSEPNPPSWPPSVYILKPGNDSYTQSIVDQVFKVNGGNDPECNGQWSNERFALLFHPGTYEIDVNVGYYTTVMGLGEDPQDTKIRNVIASNCGSVPISGALNNFWRSAENFMTTPTSTPNNHANTMQWAVSQGVSLRRVIINGSLDLYQGIGCTSGGYLSNSYVTGTINSGTQQQWYTRNTYLKTWNGGFWNMVYQGMVNAPSSLCNNASSLHTSLHSTPIIAEKPFIAYENGKYYLMIPPIEHDKVGPTDFYHLSPTDHANITKIDFAEVYVTDSRKDTASSINSKLSEGLHIVFTAGNYNFTSAIEVTKSNTVILGVGFPTIMATNGNIIIDVANGVEGVRIGGILYQAGPKNSSTLLRVGTSQTDAVGYNFLYDVFVRVGGPNDPVEIQYMTGIMVQINANNVVLDNSWLWRADHGTSGLVVNGDNPVNIALQVNGDNVRTYCLKVEHTLHNLVEWNGNDGTINMFQSEFPYDANQTYGDGGYNALRVSDNVKSFTGYGMGMYSYFRDYDVTVENAIQAPQNIDTVQFENLCTVWLWGIDGEGGEITHVIDGLGGASNADYMDTPSVVCQL